MRTVGQAEAGGDGGEIVSDIKDLGQLIDELIAVRIKQYHVMDSVNAAYPQPFLKDAEREAADIKKQISSGTFTPYALAGGRQP